MIRDNLEKSGSSLFTLKPLGEGSLPGFLGRGTAVDEVVRRIVSGDNRSLILFGRRGIGKTSLVRSWVIPEVKARHNNASYVSLRDIIAEEAIGHEQEYLKRKFVADVKIPGDGKHILFFDDFELFFGLAKNLKQAFLTVLREHFADVRGSLNFVFITSKNSLPEFYALAHDLPGLLNNIYELGTLGREGAMQAIHEQAKSTGYEFDDSLVSHLVDALEEASGTEKGVDPSLLQLVCSIVIGKQEPPGKIARGMEAESLDTLLSGYLANVCRSLEDQEALAWALLREIAMKANRDYQPDLAGVSRRFRVPESVVDEIMKEFLYTYGMVKGTYQRFEVIPEYLVKVIKKYTNPREKEIEQALSVLKRGYDNWRETQTLIPLEQVELIHRQREYLDIGEGEKGFILRCALSYESNGKLQGAGIYWLHQLEMEDQQPRQLLAYLQNESNEPNVRANAARLLGLFKTSEVCLQLGEAGIRDFDEQVRTAAIGALKEIDLEEARSQLFLRIRDEVNNPHSPYRANALRMLQVIPSEESVALASSIVEEENPPELRRVAIDTIGAIGLTSGVDQLMTIALEDKDEDDRTGAARSLGILKDPGIVEYFVSRLKLEEQNLQDALSAIRRRITLQTFIERFLKLSLIILSIEILGMVLTGVLSSVWVARVVFLVTFVSYVATAFFAARQSDKREEHHQEVRMRGLLVPIALYSLLGWVFHGFAHLLVKRYRAAFTLFAVTLTSFVLMVLYAASSETENPGTWLLALAIVLFVGSLLVDVSGAASIAGRERRKEIHNLESPALAAASVLPMIPFLGTLSVQMLFHGFAHFLVGRRKIAGAIFLTELFAITLAFFPDLFLGVLRLDQTTVGILGKVGTLTFILTFSYDVLMAAHLGRRRLTSEALARVRSLYNLIHSKEILESLLQQIDQPDSSIGNILKENEEEYVAISLVHLLKSNDYSLRTKTREILNRLKITNDKLFALLRHAVEESDDTRIRQSIVSILSKRRVYEAIGFLRSFKKEARGVLRIRVAAAIAFIRIPVSMGVTMTILAVVMCLLVWHFVADWSDELRDVRPIFTLMEERYQANSGATRGLIAALAEIAVDPKNLRSTSEWPEKLGETIRRVKEEEEAKSETATVPLDSLQSVLPDTISRYIFGHLGEGFMDRNQDRELRKAWIDGWVYIVTSTRLRAMKDFDELQGFRNLVTLLADNRQDTTLQLFILAKLAEIKNPSSIRRLGDVLQDAGYADTLRLVAFQKLCDIDAAEAVPALKRIILGEVRLMGTSQSRGSKPPLEENSENALEALRKMSNQTADVALKELSTQKRFAEQLGDYRRDGVLTTAMMERIRKHFQDGEYPRVIDDVMNKNLRGGGERKAQAYTYAGVAHYNLVLQKRSSYLAAIQTLRLAVQSAPNNEWANRVLGIAYADSGRLLPPSESRNWLNRRAKEYLSTAANIYPTSWAHGELGRLAKDEGNYDGALREINEAIKVDSNYLSAYVLRAEVLMKQKKLDEALVQYRTCIDIDPNNWESYWSMRESLHEAGRDRLAVQEFESLANRYPSNLYPLQSLTWVYHEYLSKESGSLEKAYEYGKKALAISPFDQSIKKNQVEACFTTGRYKEATVLATEVLRSPNSTGIDSLNMQFFITCSSLLAGETDTGLAYLEMFPGTYEKFSMHYSGNTWVFTGTVDYLKSLPESNEKRICQSMLALAEGHIGLQAFRETVTRYSENKKK